MFKKLNKQDGFMHLSIIIAVAAVIVVVGIVGSRVISKSDAAGSPSCVVAITRDLNNSKGQYFRIYVRLYNPTKTKKIVVNWDDNTNGTSGDTQSSVPNTTYPNLSALDHVFFSHTYKKVSTRIVTHKVVAKAYCNDGTTFSNSTVWNTYKSVN